MALVHKFDRTKFDAAQARRQAFAVQAEAAAQRQRDAVEKANNANSVPALRTIVAALADDVAKLIDAAR